MSSLEWLFRASSHRDDSGCRRANFVLLYCRGAQDSGSPSGERRYLGLYSPLIPSRSARLYHVVISCRNKRLSRIGYKAGRVPRGGSDGKKPNSKGRRETERIEGPLFYTRTKEGEAQDQGGKCSSNRVVVVQQTQQGRERAETDTRR